MLLYGISGKCVRVVCLLMDVSGVYGKVCLIYRGQVLTHTVPQLSIDHNQLGNSGMTIPVRVGRDD